MKLSSSLTGLAAILIAATTALAGAYHGQSDVLCSDCHTAHYSERGMIPEGAEPGGPFPLMLMTGSVDHLCLSCHDGTDPDAPDVLAPVTMYSTSGSEYSAGGFFSAPNGVTSIVAHDLGISVQVPLSSNSRTVTLKCTSCHEPHGNNNYRNLIFDPDSSGIGVNIILGVDIFQEISPAIPPDRSISIEAYSADNIGYKSNLSNWCIDCHSSLSNIGLGMPPAHFQQHPVSASLDGIGYHVNSNHWLSGSGQGFGAVTGDDIEGIPRLRFQSPAAADYIMSKQPGAENELNCSTCHLSHGGNHKSALIWPLSEFNSADVYSGCQQCHIK